MNPTPATDALARHLGLLLTSAEGTGEWRVAREFVLLDDSGRAQLLHDIITMFGAGDPEHQVAVTLRDLMDAAQD